MYKKLFISLICTIIAISASAQVSSFDNIVKKLGQYIIASPSEKVHLHLDKPFYSVGDDIWFKAYVVDAATSEPTGYSNVLYVDLIGPDGKLVIQKQIAINTGLGWGDFNLNDGLAEGTYRIRAYTSIMQNNAPEYFFDKSIEIGSHWSNQIVAEYAANQNKPTITFKKIDGLPIAGKKVSYAFSNFNGNTTTNQNGSITLPAIADNSVNVITTSIQIDEHQKIRKTILLPKSSNKIDVQFMPESGSMVVGLPSKIAFKAVGGNGLGMPVKGKIVDNDGVEISTFESGNLGMGIFYINPLPEKKYRAIYQNSDGSEKTVALPEPLPQGYILSVNNIDSAKFTVKAFISPAMQNKGNLKIVAQHNGAVIFSTDIPTAKPMASLSLHKSNFPSGILQLTLLSSDNTPVAERIIFIQNTADLIDIQTTGLKDSYAPLSPVQFTLNATNNTAPVPGSFSIAVTNTTVVAPDADNETNILTSLLLTDDLSGNVEKPNRYFLTNTAQMREDLDALLLTQGWRKISWETIRSGNFSSPKFTPEKALHISGRITTNNGNPIANGKISLFSSSSKLALDTLTDANGHFNFDRLQFIDSTKFVIQAKSAGTRNIKIVFDSSTSSVIPFTNLDYHGNSTTALNGYLTKTATYFDDLAKSDKLKGSDIEIKAIEIDGKRKNLASPNSSNLNGAGKADQVITAKDLENAMSLGSYIAQGRLRSVYMADGMPVSSRVVSLGDLEDPTKKSPMEVIYNGIRVSPTIIDFIPVEEIESVEVITNMSGMLMYGVSDGIIIITSKSVGITGIPNTIAGLQTFTPKGFSVAREFYIPAFLPNQPPKPDFRTTVFWNPNITTDKAGNVTVNFPNTSQSGMHRIVIEGVDADGHLARKVVNYLVN